MTKAKLLLLMLAIYPGVSLAKSCVRERTELEMCENRQDYDAEFKEITEYYAKEIGKLAAERVRKVNELKKKYKITEEAK